MPASLEQLTDIFTKADPNETGYATKEALMTALPSVEIKQGSLELRAALDAAMPNSKLKLPEFIALNDCIRVSQVPTLEELRAQVRRDRQAKEARSECRAGAGVYVATHAEPLVGGQGDEGCLEDTFQTAVALEWSKTTKMPQNPPLTRRGRQQAIELGQELVGKGITQIYCSPFLRCVQTAEAVAEMINCPFRVETGLCDWLIKAKYPTDPRPQMCSDSIFEVYPAADPEYPSLTATSELPYPEEDDQMRARLIRTMQHLVGDGHGASGLNFGSILVIAHASGVEQLCRALNAYVSLPPTPFCSLTHLVKRSNGAWLMETLLDHEFLQQGQTIRTFQPGNIPLPGTKATSGLSAEDKYDAKGGVNDKDTGLAALDADGDGVMSREEWLSQHMD